MLPNHNTQIFISVKELVKETLPNIVKLPAGTYVHINNTQQILVITMLVCLTCSIHKFLGRVKSLQICIHSSKQREVLFEF